MNNKIFIGPPGSGKTYGAKYEAVKIIWEQMTDAEKKEKYARYYNPVNFCEEAFHYVEEHYKPGIRLVSLYEGMTTSDFIEGITLDTGQGQSIFSNTGKIALQLLTEMEAASKPGFLILDDIHRVNLVGVLGELLFAFSHRNEKITLSSGKVICVPDHLYVFMTMNTLKPEFPMDTSLLTSFRVTYMENSEQRLKAAVEREFYKSAYYNIDVEIIDELLDRQRDLVDLLEEAAANDVNIAMKEGVEALFVAELSHCFDKRTVDYLQSVSFPYVWEKRTDIPMKYRKRYNEYASKFCKKMSEAYEQYSKFITPKTVEMLEAFTESVVHEYRYYNDFLDYISPEYDKDREKYQIGFTYFLPGTCFSMWNANELLQHKIRTQVLPLLYQYEIEGIITGCNLPEIDHSATVYTRDYSLVAEDKIEIILNEEYRNIFMDLYAGRKSTADVKNPMNKSQGYNPTYGVLFELVKDIIEHPLINNWRIMDLLCRDKRIYFKTDITHLYEGCLLALSKLSDKIVTAGTDNTPGNQSLTSYKRDLHAFYYKGQKYVLLSKIGLDNNECDKTVERCRLSGPVTSRYHNIYAMVKVLVYEYLRIYQNNLKAMLNETTDSMERAEIIRDIERVSQDLCTVGNIKWHGADPDERRWNLLDEIYCLPTWNLMTNGILKGAYKKMDDRYQSVMNTTGIHQMILQGPPGTSKTYGVKEFLALQAGLIDHKGEPWDSAELDARQLISENDEYILPSENLPDNNTIYWDIIQFHPSYTYEDFVRGISVSASEGNASEVSGEIFEGDLAKYKIRIKQPTSVIYKTVNRTLGKMAKIARENYNVENPDDSKKFYLVVDEINRANLATVFGELIYALEYRGSEVATPYSVGTDARLQIPDNLYILGTMNTADKSIASIDYAIRRRFLFFPVLPDIKVVFESVKEEWKDSAELRLFFIIEKLFDSYMNTDDYNRNDVQIGHTYFLRKSSDEDAFTRMRDRFLYQVIPVVREYYNDGILTEDVYGKDPEIHETACIDIIQKMTKVADMDELERMYIELMKKLMQEPFTEEIKNRLLEKHILAEA